MAAEASTKPTSPKIMTFLDRLNAPPSLSAFLLNLKASHAWEPPVQ